MTTRGTWLLILKRQIEKNDIEQQTGQQHGIVEQNNVHATIATRFRPI